MFGAFLRRECCSTRSSDDVASTIISGTSQRNKMFEGVNDSVYSGVFVLLAHVQHHSEMSIALT